MITSTYILYQPLFIQIKIYYVYNTTSYTKVIVVWKSVQIKTSTYVKIRTVWHTAFSFVNSNTWNEQ